MRVRAEHVQHVESQVGSQTEDEEIQRVVRHEAEPDVRAVCSVREHGQVTGPSCVLRQGYLECEIPVSIAL